MGLLTLLGLKSDTKELKTYLATPYTYKPNPLTLRPVKVKEHPQVYESSTSKSIRNYFDTLNKQVELTDITQSEALLNYQEPLIRTKVYDSGDNLVYRVQKTVLAKTK